MHASATSALTDGHGERRVEEHEHRAEDPQNHVGLEPRLHRSHALQDARALAQRVGEQGQHHQPSREPHGVAEIGAGRVGAEHRDAPRRGAKREDREENDGVRNETHRGCGGVRMPE